MLRKPKTLETIIKPLTTAIQDLRELEAHKTREVAATHEKITQLQEQAARDNTEAVAAHTLAGKIESLLK